MNTLAVLVDKVPSDDDIGAGVGYLVVFILLVLAVAFIGWSLTRHLRKVRENAEAGVFGHQDDPSH